MTTDQFTMGPGSPQGHKTQHDTALGAEVERVIASEFFAKSVVLSKLLDYLCSETLAERDAALKSYTVAVEGLGRSPDFDAQSDSYPRVQVARLRRLLEAYYARDGATSDPCLSIPNGSYSLKLLPRAVAYPGLQTAAPPAGQASKPDLTEPPAPAKRAVLRIGLPFPSRRMALTTIALVTLIGLAFIANSLLRPKVAAGPTAPVSAIVAVGPMSNDGDSTSASIARNATAILLDGLSRSWLLRVQASPDRTPAGDHGHVYRLETQLSATSPDGRTIYARLFDQATSTLVWSQKFEVKAGDEALANAIDSLVARVGGTFGAVYSSEIARLKDVFTPGYACALHYFRYTTTHNPQIQTKLAACVQQPAPEQRLDGTIRGLKAMSSMDFPAPAAERPALLSAGWQTAQTAVATYPEDVVANFAASRLAFAKNDCEAGIRHGRLMLAQNDSDPVLLNVVSTLMSYCQAPDAAAFVDRAFRFQVEGDTSARMTTIFMAIAAHRRDRLEILSTLPVPEDAENAAYNHFCNTMLFTALDRLSEARASWAMYKSAIGKAQNTSTDDLVGEFVPSKLARDKVVQFLRAKGVAS